jgi:transposase
MKKDSKKAKPKPKKVEAVQEGDAEIIAATAGAVEIEMLVVGIDLGDKVSHYAVLGKGKEFLDEGKIATTEEGFRRQFGHWKPARIALEAGTHSRWVAPLLSGMGHEVIVANPRQLKALTQSTRKNDAEDARKLALYARADVGILQPVQQRSQEAQRELLKLQTREAVVRVRAHLTSTVRGLVKGFGNRVRPCSTQGFVEVARESLPESLRTILQPVLDVIELATELIRQADQQVAQMVKEHPVAWRLDQVPGVGPVTAMAYVLTLEDPGRFRQSRKVGSYFGLTPWSHQSGESDPQRGITKAGNELVRRLLVQCAHRLLGPKGVDCAIRRWGAHLAGDGKNKKLKKRAVVAVARKLAVLLHVLWVSGKPFEAFPNGSREAMVA